MSIPRFRQLEALMRTLNAHPDEHWRNRMQQLASGLAEDLAGGDGEFGFKWLCNGLVDLAAEGFRLPHELYRQIEDAGRSIAAPEKQWTMLEQYVA